MATLMRPCRYLTKSIKFFIGDEEFMVHSRVVLDPGFTQLLTWMAVSQEEMMDSIQKGQKLPIKFGTKNSFFNAWHFQRIKTGRSNDSGTRLSDRVGANHINGEIWDWHRCVHSNTHQ
jgi:hypothetical protein